MVVLGSSRGWCDEEKLTIDCLELLLPASTRSRYRRLPATHPKADVRGDVHELLPPATSSICCSRLHPQLAAACKLSLLPLDLLLLMFAYFCC
jgi:hypothetical protein